LTLNSFSPRGERRDTFRKHHHPDSTKQHPEHPMGCPGGSWCAGGDAQ